MSIAKEIARRSKDIFEVIKFSEENKFFKEVEITPIEEKIYFIFKDNSILVCEGNDYYVQ